MERTPGQQPWSGVDLEEDLQTERQEPNKNTRCPRSPSDLQDPLTQNRASFSIILHGRTLSRVQTAPLSKSCKKTGTASRMTSRVDAVIIINTRMTGAGVEEADVGGERQDLYSISNQVLFLGT